MNYSKKPVQLQANLGIHLAYSEGVDCVEYFVGIDSAEIIRICEERILQGAAERAELEQKIAKLEARLDFLESRR